MLPGPRVTHQQAGSCSTSRRKHTAPAPPPGVACRPLTAQPCPDSSLSGGWLCTPAAASVSSNTTAALTVENALKHWLSPAPFTPTHIVAVACPPSPPLAVRVGMQLLQCATPPCSKPPLCPSAEQASTSPAPPLPSCRWLSAAAAGPGCTAGAVQCPSDQQQHLQPNTQERRGEGVRERTQGHQGRAAAVTASSTTHRLGCSPPQPVVVVSPSWVACKHCHCLHAST